MMEDLGGSRFDGLGIAVRKKRSQTSRRPRPEPHLFCENHDPSSLSSIPISDDTGKVSSDDNAGDADSRGKIFNLNQCMSRGPSTSKDDVDNMYKKIKEDEGGSDALHTIGGVGDGTDYGQAVARGCLGLSGDGIGNENKLKKVKLKVGGVTRTIQAKSTPNGILNNGISAKTARSLDPRARQRLILQDGADHPPLDQKSGLPGVPSKDFPRGRLSLGKMVAKNGIEKPGEKPDPVRKSRRVPKKRVLDGAFDEDEDDDELRYLEKIRIPKVAGHRDFDAESTKKQRNLLRVSKGEKYEILDEVGNSSKDGKRSRSDRGSEDTDYEEEMLSDVEPEAKKRKQRKDSFDSPPESKREITLTTRQRALLSSKDTSTTSGASQIEFPNGLPPPPPRKQKEKLTEVEQQVKKAEAAQRRRMQNEKAARESEAEAIRKILGQDSSRKKREDKMKKRQEELAQEKAANAQMLASNTIRWSMGPAGTVITFPHEMGLPKIFDPKPSRYPPPREKCAGPSCTNAYKYRDSRTKLPLCSLQCYKAINTEIQAKTACQN